jgi:hypothetical protein
MAMVTRTILADGAIELSSPEARLRITRLKPGVILLTQLGNDDDVTRASFPEFEQEILRGGSLTVFADVRGIRRMSSEVRDFSLSWGRRHRDQIHHATILVGSKIVDMAMSILAMLLGGGLIKVVSDVQTFEELLRKASPEFGSLPVLEPPPISRP